MRELLTALHEFMDPKYNAIKVFDCAWMCRNEFKTRIICESWASTVGYDTNYAYPALYMYVILYQTASKEISLIVVQ